MECPCRYCQDRWVKEIDGKVENCHTHCKKFAEWSEWYSQVSERARKQREYDRIGESPRKRPRH